MTRAEWDERLPLIQAFVEGEDIEIKVDDEWVPLDNKDEPSFLGPVKDYRVKGRFTPKIIPFTVEDAEHFRGKWVRTKHMPLRFVIRWYDDVSVCGYSYEAAFKELEFEDGRPFGKIVIPTTITKINYEGD